MKLFLDSSALVKRFVPEKGSEAVLELCAGADELGLSVLSHVEIFSALCRLRREGKLTGPIYATAKREVVQDLRDAVVCGVTETGVAQAIRLLEENTLRAMDAMHVAAALEWGADLFVSGDAGQLRAAKKAGLKVNALV